VGICLEQLNNLWGDPVCDFKTNFSDPVGPICTDSRKIIKGSFFVPLIGEKFNGHDFLSDAFARGAQATVVAREFKKDISSNCLHWIVEDTLKAYQQLALLHRSTLSIPVVAITGSVGKTTTRELIKGALKSLGSIVASFNNNNNDVGVPLTLLQATYKDSAIVVEMGMRGLGEIQRLSCCTNPDIAVITNIGTAHIGRLGSRRNIALAKCEIISCLKSSGVVIIPAYDDLLEEVLRKSWKGRVVKVAIEECVSLPFSSHEKSLLSTGIGDMFLGSVDLKRSLLGVENNVFKLPIGGKHNAINFMFALAVARELNIDLNQINEFKIGTLPGRNDSCLKGGITILDETYNASPESVTASLELLASKKGRHFAVLGTMLELGEHSVSLHRQIALLVVKLSLDGLIIVSEGTEAEVMFQETKKLPHVKIVATPEEAFPLLCSWLKPGDVVLLKASRSIGLEKLYVLLKNYL
tara:strand:- start:1160 stop:2563 length:1404 start_codon:yes stop_codon:yes gene_type:complete